MPATAIRVVILALAVAEAAKKQDGGGCTAKAVWPDGTELTRQSPPSACTPLRSVRVQTHRLTPCHVRRECIVEGERSGGGAPRLTQSPQSPHAAPPRL